MIVAALLLALLDAPAARPSPRPAVAAPVVPLDLPTEPAPDPSPEPEAGQILVPPPAPLASPAPVLSPVGEANAEPLGIRSQIGAMVVTTSEKTNLTPTIWAEVEGPIAYGNGRSLGRIGARLGLTGVPGQTSQTFSLDNYKGVEIGLQLGRVIGVLGSVRTSVRGEYAFTTLIKGAEQERPVSGLSHAGGVGLTFDARDSAAELTVLAAFDEATTTCRAPIICTGFHSGFAFVAYGQVPILDGKMLFAGDVSVPIGYDVDGVSRHAVERVYVALDPVALFRR